MRLAEDIDFKYPMKKACKSEMELFCKNIEHGHARVISCLQEKQVGHPEPCAEMQRSVIKALRWNTTPPLLAFSPFDSDLDNTHSSPWPMPLQEDKEMSTECRAEVKRDEIREAEDYRLDYRLNKECDMDIDILCGDVCSPFQGQVGANSRFVSRSASTSVVASASSTACFHPSAVKA